MQYTHPRKSDTCRICGIPIIRTSKRRDRLCNEHATERVMIAKWSKRSTDEIIEHIQSMNKTVELLQWILKNKKHIKHIDLPDGLVEEMWMSGERCMREI